MSGFSARVWYFTVKRGSWCGFKWWDDVRSMLCACTHWINFILQPYRFSDGVNLYICCCLFVTRLSCPLTSYPCTCSAWRCLTSTHRATCGRTLWWLPATSCRATRCKPVTLVQHSCSCMHVCVCASAECDHVSYAMLRHQPRGGYRKILSASSGM